MTILFLVFRRFINYTENTFYFVAVELLLEACLISFCLNR
jgi:hypothetical protein